jgi:hypothetical protein
MRFAVKGTYERGFLVSENGCYKQHNYKLKLECFPDKNEPFDMSIVEKLHTITTKENLMLNQ